MTQGCFVPSQICLGTVAWEGASMNKKGYINTTTKVTRVVKNREGEKSITTLGMGLHRGEKNRWSQDNALCEEASFPPHTPIKKKKKKHTAAILKEQHCGEKLELGMLEDLRYTARLFTVFDAFLFNTTSFLSVSNFTKHTLHQS